MNKIDGMYIMKRLYSLIIIEIVKCLILSISVAVLLTLPFMHHVAKIINYEFLYFGDNRDLLLEAIPATILIFICFYFLFFKKRIKNIKNNILNYVEKELAQKVKKYAEDVSNMTKIINEIKVHRFD